MSNHQYLGKVADEIPPETLKTLLEEGYSISPNSGRLRKRKRSGSKKSRFFSSASLKKNGMKLLRIALILAFIVSLFILFNEMNGPSEIRNSFKQKQQNK